MTKQKMITGLDIGSSKVSAVAAHADTQGIFKIIGEVTCPSKGVYKGIFTNLDEATDSISRVLAKLKDQISKRPDNVYVNISGETVKGERSRGMIPISLRGREITTADMDKCASVSSTIRLPFDRDIIHRIISSFSIDDQPWIKNPLGLYASRLACEVYIISASINHIQSIYKCVNNAGYDVEDVVFTGIADGMSLLDERQKEDGALILDMGDSITNVTIFYGGVASDLDIITTGARDILPEGGDFQTDLAGSSKFDTILSRVKSKIAGFSHRGGVSIPVIITGGLAFSDGIAEFLEDKLACPVRMGVAKDVRGDISGLDSVRLTTAIGLARYAYDKCYTKKATEEKNLVRRISSKVVDIFNNYF